MQVITCASLSGGQGKTTTSIFLGRNLARMGHRVLMVDADPQSNLTFYLGHEVQANSPTLLEVLKKQVPIEDGIYEVGEKIWLIPSDDALDKAQEFLSNSGMSALVMGKRLKEVADLFDFCIIDAPPQRSQICLTCVGASTKILIPAEASSKGLNSLIRTLDLINELQEIDAFAGELLGVVPFRDKWTGQSQANQSKKSIESMREIAGAENILPSILESEQFKKAIDQAKMLSEIGYPQLERPFKEIIQRLQQTEAPTKLKQPIAT